MFFDTITPTGKLTITLFRENGSQEEIFVKNMVVTTGKNLIASWMAGSAPSTINFMGIGSNATAPSTTDTTLGAQLARVSMSSRSATGNTVSYSATFPAGTGTGSITEAGIFNNISSGSMVCRTTFPEVVKGASDIIVINWNITVN